ncbi:MAG: AAA family ATPase [Pseudomonadota bacterium]
MSRQNISEIFANAPIFEEPNESELELTCMSDIEIKPIEWLWHNRIACGKLTVIAGDPGLGKSQTTSAITATITTGGLWHDNDIPAPLGNVIILSAEDDSADTIKPRLIAAGADINRCYVLSAVKIKDDAGKIGNRSFNLTEDIERMQEAIVKLGDVKLLIIDPISAYLGGTDSHNNSDMRGLLLPLSDMAAKHNVAVILVTHLNKASNMNMIARVTGSMALIAAARSGYVVIKDEQKPDIRYFIPIKNNIGNDSDGFAFHIEEVELMQDIKTSKICWHQEPIEAHKILYPSEEKTTATNGATEFLQELLSKEPMLVKEVFSQAEGAGYSKATVQRAAGRLKVKRVKLGMEGGWQWSLASFNLSYFRRTSEDCEDAEDCNNLREPSSEATMLSS